MGHDLIHMVLLHREPEMSLAPLDVTGMSFDPVLGLHAGESHLPSPKLCRLEQDRFTLSVPAYRRACFSRPTKGCDNPASLWFLVSIGRIRGEMAPECTMVSHLGHS